MFSWKSKKQHTVARSTAKAEYRSMTNATCEFTWPLSLPKGINIEHPRLAVLFCDDEIALYIATNPVLNERTKHIEIDYHFVREKIQNGRLKTLHVASQHQIVDLMTKPLFPTQLNFLLGKKRIHNIHSPSLRGSIRVRVKSVNL